MQIYITRDGQRMGPYTAEEVNRQLAAGTISLADLAWYEGAANWMPLSQVPGISASSTATTAMTTPVSSSMSMSGAAGNYAGFWIRFVAYLIDAVVVGVVGGIVAFIVGMVIGSGDADRATGASLIGVGIQTLIGIAYFTVLWSSGMQASLGQKVCGLRVVTTEGGQLSIARALGRYFALVLAFAILCIGVIMVAFTERKQGLHDMLASTLVVKS